MAWAFILSLTGCSKDRSEGDPGDGGDGGVADVALELSTEGLVFPAEGGRQTFSIECDGAWTIRNGSDWCVTDVASGEGNAMVEVEVAEYDGREDRNTNLTVAAGEVSRLLTVTQKKRNAIIQSPDKQEVTEEGGAFTVEIREGMEYAVTIPESCL